MAISATVQYRSFARCSRYPSDCHGPRTVAHAMGFNPLLGNRSENRLHDDKCPIRNGSGKKFFQDCVEKTAVSDSRRWVLRMAKRRQNEEADFHSPARRSTVCVCRSVGAMEQRGKACRI